jgi:hypothetical protein
MARNYADQPEPTGGIMQHGKSHCHKCGEWFHWQTHHVCASPPSQAQPPRAAPKDDFDRGYFAGWHAALAQASVSEAQPERLAPRVEPLDPYTSEHAGQPHIFIGGQSGPCYCACGAMRDDVPPAAPHLPGPSGTGTLQPAAPPDSHIPEKASVSQGMEPHQVAARWLEHAKLAKEAIKAGNPMKAYDEVDKLAAQILLAKMFGFPCDCEESGRVEGASTPAPAPAPTKKYTVAVDFDGVIHSYTSPWLDAQTIPDPPVAGAIEWLNEIAEDFDVVIFTTRGKTMDGRVAVGEWLDGHGFTQYREVTADKPPALIYLDDRAVRFDGVSFPTAQQVHQLKPWNKL